LSSCFSHEIKDLHDKSGRVPAGPADSTIAMWNVDESTNGKVKRDE